MSETETYAFEIGQLELSHFTISKTIFFSEAPIDVEELEPYYEQKRDCNRLIKYLERLPTTLQKDEIVKPATTQPPALIDDDDDSADELPPQLIKLNQKVVPAPIVKRNFKKPTQPLSHNIDIYNLFGSVNVDVPKVYADVGAALKAVSFRNKRVRKRHI